MSNCVGHEILRLVCSAHPQNRTHTKVGGYHLEELNVGKAKRNIGMPCPPPKPYTHQSRRLSSRVKKCGKSLIKMLVCSAHPKNCIHTKVSGYHLR